MKMENEVKTEIEEGLEMKMENEIKTAIEEG